MTRKIFCLAVFMFALLRGQTEHPSLTVSPTCPVEVRTYIEAFEVRLRPHDETILGPSNLPSLTVVCQDGGVLLGSITEGVIRIHLPLTLNGLRRTYPHERAHVWISPIRFNWLIEEALAEWATQEMAHLGGLWNPAAWITQTLRESAVYEPNSEYYGGGYLDFNHLMMAIAKLGASQQTGLAQDWARSGIVRLAYQGIRENPAFSAPLDDYWAARLDRLATIRSVAKHLPRTVDGQSVELWLRQQAVFRGPTFGQWVGATLLRNQAWQPGALEYSLVNPSRVETEAWEYEEYWGWGRDLRKDLYAYRRPSVPEPMILRVVNWRGSEVYARESQGVGLYQLPTFPAGAYTVELARLPDGAVLHRSQFVSGDVPEETLVLKTDWHGRITDTPVVIGNARTVLEGNGFAVIDPYCKTVRPCEITVKSSDLTETFTLITPFQDHQVLRLHNRKPVFDLPETLHLPPGGAATIQVKNLVSGIPPTYTWSLKTRDQALTVDRAEGQGEGEFTVRVDPKALPGQVLTLRFDSLQSVDTPKWIDVVVGGPPPRSRQ